MIPISQSKYCLQISIFHENLDAMKPFYLLLIITLTYCSPAHSRDIKIDSIKVYADFLLKGYTTASSYSHFDDLSKTNVEQIVVSAEDKLRIESILTNAQKRKHFQTKVGQKNLFCKITFSDDETLHRVLIGGAHMSTGMFGGRETESALIIDLTDLKNYIITNKDDLEWLSAFRASMVKN